MAETSKASPLAFQEDKTGPLPAAPPQRKSHKVLLSTMMLLQYAVWGIWVPVLGRYLEAKPSAGGEGCRVQ